MKSEKVLLRFFCIMIALLISRAAEQCMRTMSKLKTNESHQLSNPCEKDANLIMNFLDDQIEVLPFAKYEEVVFVFGAERTNKTTLVLLLTDAELEAVESSPGSNEIVFIDKDGPLNYYHPNIDSDLIPDLIPYKSRGIEFYVMPENIITTDVEQDITRTHITQRLFKFATGVKFLFTVNYESVKNGEAATDEEREEIIQLTENATSFIKDIEKYKDSMALVVTKYNSSSPQDRDDSEYINIVKVLEKVQNDFQNANNVPGISEEKRRKNLRNIQFLEIFQNVSRDQEAGKFYSKIGILRLANQTGMVRDIEYLQNEKYHIRDIIQEKIQYTQKDNDDFNYIIMDESKVHIPEIMKITEERLLTDTMNINTELKDIHVQYEKENADVEEIYNIMKKGHEVISQIKSTSPRAFVKQILEAAAILKIEISDGRINTILKHIEFMDFMEDLENISQMRRFQVKNGAEETNKYLEESEDWYSFLIELHDNLSKYEVQKNVIEYESSVTYVIEMSVMEEWEEKNVRDTGLTELLNLVGISMPSNIQNMTVNFHKLRSLENVLYRTMMDQATPYCSPGKIEVRGYNVKISSYNEMECEGNITLIDIFAMNNLFIDDDIDKTGEQVQLFLISPTIEIIGNRKFILNGKHAEPHSPNKASDGERYKVHGAPGFPGNPGGAAGCFLSIGKKYKNDKNLQIFLNGGNGGIGQHGGHGFDGVRGNDAIEPQISWIAPSTFKRNLFTFQPIAEGVVIPVFFVFFVINVYYVDGKKAEPPGDGGDGGYGGFGGSEGKTLLVGVDRDPDFQIINSIGQNGTNGTGGNGGAQTWDGDSAVLFYIDVYVLIFFLLFPPIPKFYTGEHYPKGPNGIYGGNDEDIEEPDLAEFITPALTINRYKSFLRENLPNNVQESTLREFMTGFEFDKRILDLYDTYALYDDLKLMEDQYLQLRYDLDFMPFHESLLNRTGEYANIMAESPDHVKVLRFVYTAISGKISNLRNFRQHVIIIDLLEYLELVQKNIERMSETEREISIDEQKKQYENALMEKIESALEIVESEIVPALVNAFDNIMNKIPKLIEEVLKNKDKAERELQELESEIRTFKILGAFKIIGKFAEFFGKVGKVVSKAIQLGVSFVGAIRKPLKQLSTGLVNAVLDLKEFLKEKYVLYLRQLEWIDYLLRSNPSSSDEVRKYVVDCMYEIKYFLEHTTEIMDYIYGFEWLATMRSKLGYLLLKEFQRISYEKSSKENTKAAMDTNDIVDTTIKVFDEIKAYNDKLDEYAKQEKKLAAEVAKWKKRLDDILYKLIPTFIVFQRNLVEMAQSLEQQTQFELDVSGWRVQTAVGDIKLFFKEMAEGTTLGDKLQRDVEKIDETFAVLIKIYDRIQAYLEQAKFAAYIAGINSPNSVDIRDSRLRDLVLQLKYLLQTNIVMDQYEIAIHSFKQHLFPFAHIHLATFNLPTGLEANDTKTIVRRAADEISYLQEQTKILEISIGKYDREIFGNIDFNSDDSSIAVPFYTFRSREYKEDIKNLLKGEEIMIRADVKSALNQNAVKFNEIGINLKLVDGKDGEQSKLNAELEKFGVRMTMVGHNYYRCGNKFYYLSVDDNCVIEYSFKRNIDGKPIKYNDVYRKLNDKNYFLSPYAMWKIKLVNIFDDFELKNQSVQSTQNAFDEIYGYRDESMNLEIFGRGQYFRAEGLFANEVCTEEIEKYYDYDRTTIDSNVEQTKRIYSL